MSGRPEPDEQSRLAQQGCCASGGSCAEPAAGAVIDPGWRRAAGRARLLSWLSLAYMGLEGTVAVIAAVVAGSVALLGFGLDSVIEGLASATIVWRFTGSRTLSESAEAVAQKAVAVTFFLLAPYIAYDAIVTLVARERAATSWVGIGLSISSLIVMPILGIAKKRLGVRLGSGATAGEGAQNLLCAYLAAGVLIGLLANTFLAWWWLDPVVALFISGLAIWEGMKSWRGEDCC
ncbi:divalent metal cation (Fe/Co/Zn/Cd) transporter [Mycobacterium sp. MAA66]